jgi:hypothetical protein
MTLFGIHENKRVLESFILLQECLDTDFKALIVELKWKLLFLSLNFLILHSPKREISGSLLQIDFSLHQLDLLQMLFALLTIVVHLSLNLDQFVLNVLLHLFEMLDLKIVFSLQLLELLFGVVSVHYCLLVLSFKNGYLLLERFYRSLLIIFLLF